MDHLERYVTEENLALFVDLIEQEQDDCQRTLLKNMLVAEENRYAANAERLDVAELCRDKCLKRIDAQRSRIAAMRDGHPHKATAELFLANLLDLQALVEFRITGLKRRIDGM